MTKYDTKGMQNKRWDNVGNNSRHVDSESDSALIEAKVANLARSHLKYSRQPANKIGC